MPRLTAPLLLLAGLLALLLAPLPASARITGFEVLRVEPAFGGRAFGDAGPYQRVVARAYGEVDPAHPRNVLIQDIALAPRNARGRVEYETEVEIFRPADPAKAAGVLLFDIVNRGNRRLLSTYNGAPGGNAGVDPGDGFLMRRGLVLVAFGWQGDLLPGEGRLRLRVPVAQAPDGASITGTVRAEFVVPTATTTVGLAQGGLAGPTHRAYPSATQGSDAPGPEGFRPILTVRAHQQAPRRPIAPEAWSFGACHEGRPLRASATEICMPGGFEPGQLYELVYRARDPLVLGLGFAAMRDLGAYLKRGTGAAHPLPRPGGWTTVVHGTSQSGRMLRTFLHLGFNEGLTGRRVFDGAIAHVAAGRLPLNTRFGQPGRAWGHQVDNLYPAYDFPWAYSRVTDPVTERTQGIMDRCTESGTCPRLIHAASALEMWEGRQSLALTDPLGRADLPEPEWVRQYLLAGTQHGAWAGRLPTDPAVIGCTQLPNPNPQLHAMRALLVALMDWVTEGREPPPSAVPRIADGTLVRPPEVRFPPIPANRYFGVARPPLRYTGIANPLHLLDHGPSFDAANLSGIANREPPGIGQPEYPVLVPQVDGDGNDIAGIRSLQLAVPLGTYTGWNLYPSGRFGGGLCSLMGSFVPFAQTRAEREAAGDPRPSIEERYPTPDAYMEAVLAAAFRLVRARHLLPEDAVALIAEAERTGPVPPR